MGTIWTIITEKGFPGEHGFVNLKHVTAQSFLHLQTDTAFNTISAVRMDEKYTVKLDAFHMPMFVIVC